jgi:WD40 repeat protein
MLFMNQGMYIPLYDVQAGNEPIARIYDFSVGDHVEARDISFSADSRLFAVAGAVGRVAVYELATGRMVFSYSDTYLARSLSEIRFNATGNYIMVADFNRTCFWVYSTTNGQTVYNMNATKEIRDWGFDLETGDAVMWYTDGSAQVFRMFEDEDSLIAYAREKAAK